MGRMYAMVTGLCFLAGERGERGRALFVRCLDALSEEDGGPRFGAACRLLCDDSAWAVKVQIMGTLNTLVIIGASEEEVMPCACYGV